MSTLWLWAALTPLVGLVSNPLLLILLLAIAGVMGAVWNVSTGTIYMRLIPDRLMARVTSAGSLTAFGALPVGALLAGLLVQAYGPATTGVMAGAGMLLIAALTTAAPSVRRGPPTVPASASRSETA
jgi:hypothetical protein